MSGPTPIAAPYRLSFLYTVGTFQHKTRFFLNVDPSGDSSGFDTVPRSGYATVGLSIAVNTLYTLMAPFWANADTDFDFAVLEQRVGTTYVFVNNVTTTVTPTGTGAFQPANQTCFSGKSSAQRNAPVYFYEGIFGQANKISSPASLSGALAAMADALWNVFGTAADDSPYVWSVDRGNAVRKRFLAYVVDTNEKLRRIRRIK